MKMRDPANSQMGVQFSLDCKSVVFGGAFHAHHPDQSHGQAEEFPNMCRRRMTMSGTGSPTDEITFLSKTYNSLLLQTHIESNGESRIGKVQHRGEQGSGARTGGTMACTLQRIDHSSPNIDVVNDAFPDSDEGTARR